MKLISDIEQLTCTLLMALLLAGPALALDSSSVTPPGDNSPATSNPDAAPVTVASTSLPAAIQAPNAMIGKVNPPIPTIRYKGLTDQATFMYLRTDTGYALNTSSGLKNENLTGIGVQWTWRKFYPLDILGTYRLEHGSVLSQTFQTAAVGVGYAHPIYRFAPLVQLQAGISRTTSQHYMYLYDGARTGFTTLIGAGVDMKVNGNWGVRPVFVEFQYLPYGQIHSKYWNFGTGIFYRFHQQSTTY